MTILEEFHLARIEEFDGPGRLGRHIEHDERSKLFAIQEAGVTLKTVLWDRMVPILDQGNVGSCTGNAATGCLGSQPFFDSLGGSSNKWDEKVALELYHEATVLDGFNGTYPPDDTGSTGLAVAKACQNDKMISGYQHAFSMNAALAGVMAGPIIIGINWYEGFDSPDDKGFVSISGGVRGGHELVMRGINVDARVVFCDNSWGGGWGNKGSFVFSWDDFDRLLGEGGDATLFTPVTQPPPAPTPTPDQTPDEIFAKASAAYWKAYKTWRKAVGV